MSGAKGTTNSDILLNVSTGEVLSLGAEAHVHIGTVSGRPVIVKRRLKKAYRHEILDKKLTKHRIQAEAKTLRLLRTKGVAVPELLAVDDKDGVIVMERIPGPTVKALVLESVAAGDEEKVKSICRALGRAVAEAHNAGVIHGDLTTSNAIAREPDGVIILIDFGLSSIGTASEERAVDLYVLERAFASTHPESELLSSHIIEAYGETAKGSKETLKRLEAVRLRGRKRTMVG